MWTRQTDQLGVLWTHCSLVISVTSQVKSILFITSVFWVVSLFCQMWRLNQDLISVKPAVLVRFLVSASGCWLGRSSYLCLCVCGSWSVMRDITKVITIRFSFRAEQPLTECIIYFHGGWRSCSRARPNGGVLMRHPGLCYAGVSSWVICIFNFCARISNMYEGERTTISRMFPPHLCLLIHETLYVRPFLTDVEIVTDIKIRFTDFHHKPFFSH